MEDSGGEKQVWLPGVGERPLSEVTIDLLLESASLLEQSPRNAVMVHLKAAFRRLDEIRQEDAGDAEKAEVGRLEQRIAEYNDWLGQAD